MAPTASVCAGRVLDAKGYGLPKTVIATEEALHIALIGDEHPFMPEIPFYSDGQPSEVINYGWLADYEVRSPGPDGFIMRLAVCSPERAATGDSGHIWDDPETKILLLGLPTSAAGHAVCEQIIAGIHIHSRLFCEQVSSLGRPISGVT